MRAIILFLLLLPVAAFAQTTITGKIVDADSKPVPYASVFLSNATVGTSSAADGSFTLNNVKTGQYDLVISFIGYQTHHQNIAVSNSAISLPAIVMQVKANQLKEVKIGPPDANRNRYLDRFTREFLGSSANAAQCRILNPDILDISYDKDIHTLSASSDEFLIIENKALGYKLRYQLSHFTMRWEGNMFGNYQTYYDGPVLFEDIKGSASQIKGWAKARLQTYHGSCMHFLRSMFTNQFAAEGFKVMKLVRKANPARPPDSLLKAKMHQYYLGLNAHPEWKDSLQYYGDKVGLPKIMEYLVAKPLTLPDFARSTDNPDMLALQYTDYLYIVYTQRHDDSNNRGIYHPLDMPDYPTSIITLYHPYAIFDRNGIFIDPSSTVFEGAWGHSGVADMLPIDYEPVLH